MLYAQVESRNIRKCKMIKAFTKNMQGKSDVVNRANTHIVVCDYSYSRRNHCSLCYATEQCMTLSQGMRVNMELTNKTQGRKKI